MARKTRKSTAEQLVSRICGLKPNGDTIMIHIEGFYNKTRRHSSIGYISPIEMELKAA